MEVEEAGPRDLDPFYEVGGREVFDDRLCRRPWISALPPRRCQRDVGRPIAVLASLRTIELDLWSPVDGDVAARTRRFQRSGHELPELVRDHGWPTSLKTRSVRS